MPSRANLGSVVMCMPVMVVAMVKILLQKLAIAGKCHHNCGVEPGTASNIIVIDPGKMAASLSGVKFQ